MVWVKICGITTEEDALLCVAMGANALGFVFAPGSKRQVSTANVVDIVKRLDPEVLTIGVFRDEMPERVVELVRRAGLRGAQLHGHETAEAAAYVAANVGFSIQAFPAGDPAITRTGTSAVSALLIDNPRPGSGEVFDWSLAEGVPPGKRLILAGGLDADNVGEAISQVRPWGVDVSTGVESAPGIKDARKVRAFVRAAREADPDSGDDFGTEALRVPLPGPEGPYDWADEDN
jgi:phosphoribosylanthranilate isomerase